MNVLILTPDRVGSTLLQRLITVYMVAHDFDRPVINLHELTNGLMKYYSPTFNQEVLGKPNDPDKPWGYYQSLPEITELLASTDHYKTSRLAHYHILNRQDTIAEQVPFYNYLNDNFFIISAQRDNLLEHALSWCIKLESKRLNVFSHQEKIDTFSELYRNKITVSIEALIKYLDRYVEYQTWAHNHFDVSSYFRYDQDLPRIEEYIMGLNIFNQQDKKKTWKEIFNIDFSDWNRCHYLCSDISGLGKQVVSVNQQLTYDNKDIDVAKFELQTVDQKDILKQLSHDDQKFLVTNLKGYHHAHEAIQELVDNKVLVTPVPIKLQTMLEKKLLINNFDECVRAYNAWVARTGHGVPYTKEDLSKSIANEVKQWHATPLLT